MYGFSDSFFGSTFDKYQEHKWFISILSIMHILCIKLTQTFLHPEKKQMINLRLLLHMPITIEWGGGRDYHCKCERNADLKNCIWWQTTCSMCLEHKGFCQLFKVSTCYIFQGLTVQMCQAEFGLQCLD